MNIAIEKTSNCRYMLAYIMYGATFMCACVHLYVVNVCVYIVCEMHVVHCEHVCVGTYEGICTKGREEMN